MKTHENDTFTVSQTNPAFNYPKTNESLCTEARDRLLHRHHSPQSVDPFKIYIHVTLKFYADHRAKAEMITSNTNF